MKFNKTWGTVLAAVLAVASFVVSFKLGLIVCALLILARFVWGPSDSDGIIGIDHIDRPRSSTYGGGFAPGGLFGVSGLGAHFGVYGAPVADPKSPRKEYDPLEKTASFSKSQRRDLAAAIKEAEARTGHQILAAIGALEDDHAEKADRIAAQWPTASIVVCIDPTRKIFELRWRDGSFALDAEHTASFANMISRSDLAAAIALLAEVLPVQAAVTELPDIVED